MPEGLPVGKALPRLESASPFINHSSFFPFSVRVLSRFADAAGRPERGKAGNTFQIGLVAAIVKIGVGLKNSSISA